MSLGNDYCEFSNHCQSASHSPLFIGNLVGKNQFLIFFTEISMIDPDFLKFTFLRET